MRNIRLLLQYEGTRYQGWQRQQSTDHTIQGKLETLLSKMCKETIEIQGSGRTDAGVHALGQVANFHTNSEMTVEEMQTYMNTYLPEDIAVLQVAEAGSRFHSRLNASGKHYIYRVINSGIPDVFLRRYAIRVPEKLDLDAMRKAASYLCGEHDFKSFTSAKKGKKSTVRRIDSIEIIQEDALLTFSFQGNGFLHHMIRILMGTLLEVGKGERSPESIPELLDAKNRELAGPLMPAKGLTLVEIFFS
ncbi:MAG: tRNA pseudouridine(38-40) synthase TruA [Lachnospiraceae bacterium]|nr:tRNA pseudouridine(38-40) synthase TruA [Lachnospiraceae bacterium]